MLLLLFLFLSFHFSLLINSFIYLIYIICSLMFTNLAYCISNHSNRLNKWSIHFNLLHVQISLYRKGRNKHIYRYFPLFLYLLTTIIICVSRSRSLIASVTRTLYLFFSPVYIYIYISLYLFSIYMYVIHHFYHKTTTTIIVIKFTFFL